MTATIGKRPKQDIEKEFAIEPQNVFFDSDLVRRELNLQFVEIGKEKDKFNVLNTLLNTYTQRKAIVYFYDIPDCKSFSKKLNEIGITSGHYYSGMHSKEKDNVYEAFKEGKINVLCATTAFGMGMNIADIDMIVHHRMPNSIEEYYQQVGRAARDKTICPSANCFLLWSEANFRFKYDEHIPAAIISPQQIEEGFRKLGLTGKAGIPQSLEYSDYIKQDLGRLRYCFERRGVLKTIGEVNGTPKSIVFFKENKKWEVIVAKMATGNSFIRAAANSDITLQELIDYIFEKELNGEIKTFPAREKKIFFVSDFNEVPIETGYLITDESITLSDYKKIQVDKLYELVHSDDAQAFIENYFLREADKT